MSHIKEIIRDPLGTLIGHKQKYPLDDEKDLKIDYSMENSIVKDLEGINFKGFKCWIPEINYAKVVDVYDGDTVHIVAKPQNGDGNLYRFAVRLRHIDTPEMHIEPVKANEAKQHLMNLVLNKVVKLEELSYEKYGRLLATLRTYTRLENNDRFTWDPIDVSRQMLNAGYGKPYEGGKKE